MRKGGASVPVMRPKGDETMATEVDPLELATMQLQVEQERERRFLATLTEENREFVVRSEKLRAQFMRLLQVMLTETNVHLRMDASTWVAKNAVDVGERNALVMKMRVRFFQTHW